MLDGMHLCVICENTVSTQAEGENTKTCVNGRTSTNMNAAPSRYQYDSSQVVLLKDE